MSRSKLRRTVVRLGSGVPASGSVQVCEDGTSTPLSATLFADDSSGTTLPNPFDFSDGLIEAFLDQPQRVRVIVTAAGTTPQVFDNVDVFPPAGTIWDDALPTSTTYSLTTGAWTYGLNQGVFVPASVSDFAQLTYQSEILPNTQWAFHVGDQIVILDGGLYNLSVTGHVYGTPGDVIKVGASIDGGAIATSHQVNTTITGEAGVVTQDGDDRDGMSISNFSMEWTGLVVLNNDGALLDFTAQRMSGTGPMKVQLTAILTQLRSNGESVPPPSLDA